MSALSLTGLKMLTYSMYKQQSTGYLLHFQKNVLSCFSRNGKPL